MPITSPSSDDDVAVRVGLLLALVLAVVSRLGWPGLIEFKNDESWALRVASSIARSQAHPLVGIGSSLGIPNAPFFVYLMAIPELISHDPAVATAVIGVLGVVAVGITFVFGRWLANDVAGVTAALLFAVSPWGIIYSRKVWEQDALPAFVGLGMLALFAALRDGRRGWIAPGVVLLSLAVQLHPTASALVAPATILIVGCLVADRAAPGRTLRWLAAGIGASAILETPFVIWQFRAGWPLLDAVGHLASDPARFDLTALYLAIDTSLGNGYPSLANVDDGWGPAFSIELALLVSGLSLTVLQAWRASKRDDRFIAGALIAWTIAPILLQLRHSVPVFPHYFIVLFPVPFLLMGLTTSAFWSFDRWAKRRTGAGHPRFSVATKGAVVLAIALPVGFGMQSYAGYMSALANGMIRPEFGVPLARQQALLSEAGRVAAAGPVYLGAHDDLAPSLEYLGDGQVRSFDDRVGLLLPPGDRPAAVILSDRQSTAWTILQRVADGPIETIALRPSHILEVFRLSSLTAPGLPDFVAVNTAFDDGISLISYRITPSLTPRAVDVAVVLHLTGAPPKTIPTAFNHLLTADGRSAAQLDRPAYVPLDWRPGDSILSEFLLSWPSEPGPYRLEFGLYEFPSMQRHLLVAPSASGSKDSVVFGPIDLSTH